MAKRSRASLDKLQPLQPCRLRKTTLTNMGNMLKLMTMSLMIQIMLSRCEQFVYCLADVRDVSPQSPDIFSPVYSPGVEHHTVMVRKDKSWYFPFMCVVSTCFNPQFAWEKHWDFTCQPFDWFSRVFLGKFAGGCRKTTDVFLKSIYFWLVKTSRLLVKSDEILRSITSF